MIQAEEAEVPWVDPTAIPYGNPLRHHIKDVYSGIVLHVRYQISFFRRPAKWRDLHGVVHHTETMKIFGHVDRVTLCRAIRLNKFAQAPIASARLDIEHCKASVNCLSCIGAMDDSRG